jgi:hypothetical protein
VTRPADAIIDALAVHRITRLGTQDRITQDVRIRLARRGPRWDYLFGSEDHDGCAWCMSLWVAVAVHAARRLAPRVWDPLAHILAASTLTGLVTTNLD